MKRLYAAICELIEAKAHATANPVELEPERAGADAMIERSGAPEPNELHSQNNDEPLYKQQIGFTFPRLDIDMAGIKDAAYRDHDRMRRGRR